MTVCYKKLWKLLIDRNLTKTDLLKMSGISSATLAKLGKDQNVNTDSLVKICSSLNCPVDEIMEIIPQSSRQL